MPWFISLMAKPSRQSHLKNYCLTPSTTGERKTMHAVDLIRKKRDGEELSPEEIQFLAQGAAIETIPEEQLAAWLMAGLLRGLGLPEGDALATAMTLWGEVFGPSPLTRFAVDKHSTGGVGDKTSFLVAPITA